MTASRVLWGLVLILVGGAFLAANLNLLSWDFVLSLWRLWPLILVLLGLGVLFRGRNQWVAALLMLAVLAAGGGLVAADRGAAGLSNGARIVRIEGPAVSGVLSAQTTIDVGAARLDIRGGETGKVVQGTYESRREPVISQLSHRGAYTLKVARQGSGVSVLPFLNRGQEALALTLAPGIPWRLEIDTGAANGTIDLERVVLEDLVIDAGASSIDVTVGPDIVDGARVLIEGGAGAYRLRLPRSLDLTVHTSGAVSSVDVDPLMQRSGDNTYTYKGGNDRLTVNLSAGVSSIRVELY
ncbi:MAG: DUF5668 domain-containing protein [Actinobacteria bacterium]|nr:DUF5668 domain-containing protein [Actinomycetota bacterium]